MRFLWRRFIGLNLWLMAALFAAIYLIDSFPSYIANVLIGNYWSVAGAFIFLIICGNILLSVAE